MDDALSWVQASRQSDIASLQRLRQTGKLITTVSELVHQLQRERGRALCGFVLKAGFTVSSGSPVSRM